MWRRQVSSNRECEAAPPEGANPQPANPPDGVTATVTLAEILLLARQVVRALRSRGSGTAGPWVDRVPRIISPS